ncbi:ATP-dependent DNA helicase UvrD2 [Actinotalea sp.]|uniref:ATP-dependent helicase n=1 Tax=Actinotalea sp. TaxID=1872145 RepID=UPI002CEFF4C8|nr:ATP-dependent DNA helicase UvrD2 [Actinotalea sp.]HQY34107.1 ATP-dependent DNA helicase UvrD2 [Actinotalea sp.]HRA49507.1 ATP-dependent DNA helicase UvrD2 [Actinotalea sp.]
MSADQLLQALDPDQREVALALTGPVCVLAGAGTGKTRAITHRIAYGVRTGTYPATSVLAVTFTARAAGEMRTRLRDLGVAGVQARTFHAAALRQLSFFWPKVVGGAPPRILDHKAPVVADAASRLGLRVDRLSVRDLASEIEWSKVSLVTADDYVRAATATDRPPPAGYDRATVARLISAYEQAKDDRGVIDFEDVLTMLGTMLETHRDIAEQVRAQYRHFVVDEYQDVSPAQQYLLDQWLGGRHELCVVGDPSQTIYSFTGATPHHLLTFTEKHPGARVVRLVRDYRSTPQVVGLANRLLSGGPRGRRQPGALELIAQRPSGPPVAMTSYPDDEAEAAAVAARIGRLVAAGTPARECAVLYRTNAQSEAYEQALADAGIGYLVRGGERFFSRPEVRAAVLLLRGAARSMADVPLGEAVRDVLASAGWSPVPPAARGAVRERWDALAALVQLADDLAVRLAPPGAAGGPVDGAGDGDGDPATGATLVGLVAELDERAAAQHAPSVDGVTLASLHAAKGLEWDAVFLVGMSEGLMPISLAETDAALAEERRLLYVGVTRAREHLQLSHARARNPGGRATRRRTRFLDGIWPDESPTRRSPSDAGLRRHPRPLEEGAGDADPELLEALRTWRTQVATETDKPAFTVLLDGPLTDVARTRPASVADLARIRGIGPAKIDRHGAALLAIVAGHRVP